MQCSDQLFFPKVRHISGTGHIKLTFSILRTHNPPFHPEQPGLAREEPGEVWQEASQVWICCVSIKLSPMNCSGDISYSCVQVHRARGGQEAVVPRLCHGWPRQGGSQGDGRTAGHLQQLVIIASDDVMDLNSGLLSSRTN